MKTPGVVKNIDRRCPCLRTSREYPPVPLVNVDMFEDKDFLVNRLYYAVPSFQRAPSCLLYYERTRSGKKNGSLTLVHSEIVEDGSAPCPPSPWLFPWLCQGFSFMRLPACPITPCICLGVEYNRTQRKPEKSLRPFILGAAEQEEP